MPCGHVFGQTGRKTISVQLHVPAVNYLLRILILPLSAIEKFLFVVVSRQTKKDFSAPSVVNKSSSALIGENLRLITLNAMRSALCCPLVCDNLRKSAVKFLKSDSSASICGSYAFAELCTLCVFARGVFSVLGALPHVLCCFPVCENLRLIAPSALLAAGFASCFASSRESSF